jgi:nucleoside-diphosphate-sugar epimerase
VERGHTVRAADRMYRADLPVRVDVVDLLDRHACYQILDGAEALVHLANHPSFGRGRDPQTVCNENVCMNMNVFQAAADTGVSKIAFSSTIQVLTTNRCTAPGRRRPLFPYLPLDSDVPADPDNPYSLSKALSEDMLLYFARLHGMSCVAVRFPFLSDGDAERWLAANDHDSTAVPEAFSSLQLPDAAALLEAVITSDLPGYRTYFPAVSRIEPGKTVADVIRQYYSDVPLRKPIEQIEGLIDISKIEKETGWRPKFAA